jgi:hypothetical protein
MELKSVVFLKFSMLFPGLFPPNVTKNAPFLSERSFKDRNVRIAGVIFPAQMVSQQQRNHSPQLVL